MTDERVIRLLRAALFGLALAAVPLAAQNLAPGSLVGTVTDEVTGDPLEGVTIAIAGHDIRTTTDAQGLFGLDGLPNGKLALRVELSGYATVTEQIEILPDEVSLFQLQLSPLAYALQGIIVRAWRDDPQATSVPIEREDKFVVTALDLLRQQVPGVLVRSRPGARSGVRIRGASSLSPGVPAIYVDGIRVGEGGSNSPISALEQIPAERVLRIRVLRGPSAAAQYADAASGVILIETR
jgi:outer membrane receptor protein involved in Fe transport